ncbi:MAG TPA: bifunctional UDP-N-acetylglucosamine diphosphorylase/glucosamine-1-phosphate N-acetyltransferase GlmU, partial [Paracoccaceae bacterium]|nr:bifunctional UDP-N-acetylglucosamine diphosphorylase/glucosamine-1-phosphate N-acetyltransferase GlmU [Paracoccaceae bacterium]
DALILYGDTPFITPETLSRMVEKRTEGNAIVVLGFHTDTPGRYGRLMIDDDGSLDAIIEAKDCTEGQLMVDYCNSGVLCAPAPLLFALLDDVSNDNAAGEFYLTDVIALARGRGLKCAAIACDEAETMGVNSRADLAAAEAAFQARARAEAMENGATLIDPSTVFFAFDTYLGRDVVIEPNVFFGPGVTVESGATIKAFCHLEGCHISEGCIIGPFARLRPGAELGGGVRIGNFVEVKNAEMAQGSKANHLAYIGDGTVGKDTNIGAGTIFCNYDGVMKHRTEIGERAFIGSNSALVAPVRIGTEAVIASGSVITSDVPDGALAIGRGKQENKPKLGMRLMDRLRAIKASKS